MNLARENEPRNGCAKLLYWKEMRPNVVLKPDTRKRSQEIVSSSSSPVVSVDGSTFQCGTFEEVTNVF